MDDWTALMLSRQTSQELQRDAARHRLAKQAAAPACGRQSRDSARTGGVTTLPGDSQRRLSLQRQEAS